MASGFACLETSSAGEDARTHLSKRAVLAPKNKEVDSFNKQLLAKFPEDTVREYASSDTIGDASAEDYANYPIEFLNSIELPGLPPHRLQVCSGAVVILLLLPDLRGHVAARASQSSHVYLPYY